MIRFATADDCNNLAVLASSVWLEMYAQQGISRQHSEYVLTHLSPEVFKKFLDSKRDSVMVVTDKCNLVGLAVVRLDSHFQSPVYGFEIERFYIHPSYRNKGLGRQLLRFINAEIGNVYWLYTWVENAANAFYEYVGFSKIGQYSFNFGQHQIVNNVYASTEKTWEAR